MATKKNRRTIDFNTVLRDDEGQPIKWGDRTSKSGGDMLLGDACRRALKMSGQKDPATGQGEKIDRDEAKKRWKLARQIAKPKDRDKGNYAILSLRKNICELIQECVDEVWGTEVQIPANELLDGIAPEEIWEEDPESVDRTREVTGDDVDWEEEEEDEEEDAADPKPGAPGEPAS